MEVVLGQEPALDGGRNNETSSSAASAAEQLNEMEVILGQEPNNEVEDIFRSHSESPRPDRLQVPSLQRATSLEMEAVLTQGNTVEIFTNQTPYQDITRKESQSESAQGFTPLEKGQDTSSKKKNQLDEEEKLAGTEYGLSITTNRLDEEQDTTCTRPFGLQDIWCSPELFMTRASNSSPKAFQPETLQKKDIYVEIHQKTKECKTSNRNVAERGQRPTCSTPSSFNDCDSQASNKLEGTEVVLGKEPIQSRNTPKDRSTPMTFLLKDNLVTNSTDVPILAGKRIANTCSSSPQPENEAAHLRYQSTTEVPSVPTESRKNYTRTDHRHAIKRNRSFLRRLSKDGAQSEPSAELTAPLRDPMLPKKSMTSSVDATMSRERSNVKARTLARKKTSFRKKQSSSKITLATVPEDREATNLGSQTRSFARPRSLSMKDQKGLNHLPLQTESEPKRVQRSRSLALKPHRKEPEALGTLSHSTALGKGISRSRSLSNPVSSIGKLSVPAAESAQPSITLEDISGRRQMKKSRSSLSLARKKSVHPVAKQNPETNHLDDNVKDILSKLQANPNPLSKASSKDAPKKRSRRKKPATAVESANSSKNVLEAYTRFQALHENRKENLSKENELDNLVYEISGTTHNRQASRGRDMTRRCAPTKNQGSGRRAISRHLQLQLAIAAAEAHSRIEREYQEKQLRPMQDDAMSTMSTATGTATCPLVPTADLTCWKQ